MTKIKNFFKNITNSKKKVFALALSVCVVVLSIAGSSIAYFTDTESYTNVFTSGNVQITLSGAADANEAVYPGKTVTRDTKIDNVGQSDAYIGAVVTLSSANVGKYLSATSGTSGKVYVGDFLTDLATVHKIETVETDGVVTAFKIYIVYGTALTSAAEPVQVLTGMQIPTTWNNDEMASISNLNLTVDAYAVQTDSFGTALAALQAAFPEAFPTPAP